MANYYFDKSIYLSNYWNNNIKEYFGAGFTNPQLIMDVFLLRNYINNAVPILLYFKHADLFCFNEMQKIALICMFFNSLGCYCAWRAADISVSKAAIFSQGNNYVALMLGFVFLGEIKLLNPKVIVGIILCFGAGIIFFFGKQKDRSLIGWIIGFSLCWGVDDFFTRYFALNQIPTINFLVARYLGTYVGTLLLLFAANMVIKLGVNRIGFDAKKDLIKTSVKGRVNQIFILAIVGAWLPMVLEYWIRQKAPLVGTEPIFLVLSITVPVILIFCFLPFLMKLKIIPKKYLERAYEEYKEARNVSPIEKIVYVLGIAGGIFVGFAL